MKLTLRHHHIFPRLVGAASTAVPTLLSSQAWDQVRTMEAGDAFYMPEERAKWIEVCQNASLAAACAQSIVEKFAEKDWSTVLSVGVGRACLEFHLKFLRPNVRLICTEFSPQVVARLGRVFNECDEIKSFDLLSDQWPRLDSTGLLLMNRVDTELTDSQWRELFRRTDAVGIEHILLIASGFVDPKMLLYELSLRLRATLIRRPLTHAGYLRTKSRMKELWANHYRIESEDVYGGLTGFLLQRITSASIAPEDRGQLTA